MKLNCTHVLNIEVQSLFCSLYLPFNGSLMLAACSSSKPEEAAAPRITIEEAMTQCQQASGENADRAVFDACMKGKGYQRTAESVASDPAASL